ncbi:MAG TPA: sensor histidine kinase [Ruminiclostridium sp.]|nr:sensor histidine kinase [Ruminiclostridium sp.]
MVRTTKKAVYTLKILFISFTVFCLAVNSTLRFGEVSVLLAMTAVIIYREKYNSAVYITWVELACVCAGAWLDPAFFVLFCLPAFDFAMSGTLYFAAAPVLLQIVLSSTAKDLPMLLLLNLICCLFGYMMKVSTRKEKEFKEAFDRERRLRYELEQVKGRLLGATKEAARLAEMQERNRIAREIHDSVGHRTSAVLIELRAAYRLFDKDVQKAKETVGVCIDALAKTMELLRDTVHNIKPAGLLGAAYIKRIIENFKFCPVNFKFEGDFAAVTPDVLEILGANITEALTNVQRHSGAGSVSVSIDITPNYIRLHIKDDGKAAGAFKEGMGIGGMRERIENIGGTMSVSNDSGFMIVCVIPVQNGKGGFIE